MAVVCPQKRGCLRWKQGEETWRPLRSPLRFLATATRVARSKETWRPQGSPLHFLVRVEHIELVVSIVTCLRHKYFDESSDDNSDNDDLDDDHDNPYPGERCVRHVGGGSGIQ